LMDVGGSPSVELRAAMEQHLHQPHHAWGGACRES
jgi:hypothetical protein